MLPDLCKVFALSLLPVVELRGAIPLGYYLGLPFWASYLCAVVGNLLPVPFILFFVERVLDFMKRHAILPRFVGWLETKAQKGAARVSAYALAGLFLFVAVPLPGTGAWTGSLIAALFHMKKKWAMLSVLLGVLSAGVLVTVIMYCGVESLSFLVKK